MRTSDVRAALAQNLAELMLNEAFPDLPPEWATHTCRAMVGKMLGVDEGFDLSAAASAARHEIGVLSGLHHRLIYSDEAINAALAHYIEDEVESTRKPFESAPDDAPAPNTREQFLRSIAEGLIETALEGIPIPERTVEDLCPAVVEALKGGTNESVDDEGARQVIRQRVLSWTRNGLELDQAAFERQLAAA